MAGVPVGFVADWINVMLAELFDKQFAQNTGRGDEGFGLATKYVYGPRYVNAAATRVDLATIATKFRTDDDLVNRTRNVERGIEGDG